MFLFYFCAEQINILVMDIELIYWNALVSFKTCFLLFGTKQVVLWAHPGMGWQWWKVFEYLNASWWSYLLKGSGGLSAVYSCTVCPGFQLGIKILKVSVFTCIPACHHRWGSRQGRHRSWRELWQPERRTQIWMSPGANVVKPFTSVIYNFCNKLVCLSLAILSSLV